MPIARRLVTSSMPSRDYDVILVQSQSSKLSWSETTTADQLSVWNCEQTLKENVRFTTILPEKKHFARPNSDRNLALFIPTALRSQT